MLWISSISMFSLSLYLSMLSKTMIIEWSMISINASEIFLPVIMDPMGTMFSATVLFISANVIHFSNYYMQDEPFIKRFTHIVLLFVLSMNMLIFIPHLMILLLGWDGLGITSFILVIYYQNPKSLAAGMITALTNRVGDVMILLSIAWSMNQGHWLIINMWDSKFSLMMCVTITVAAMTKSAQMPFSSWLPAAMAAPTPVSALVHSSTLVTAGVFLIIRFYPMLSKFFLFNLSLLMISTMTMFMAGMSALVETDLKKIIALSTLSQLGVMMASISLNLPNLAFFHLVTHAMFKALLFVCAGSLIHLHHHNQDLRSMGNTSNQLPITMACLLAANMALCGLPFMAGFYSKDMIIEMCLFNQSNSIIVIMFLIATMMTAAYSIRLMATALISNNMSLPAQYTTDNTTSNTTPMMFLSMGAITGGSLINWLAVLPMKEPILDLNLKLMALVVTVLGALIMFSKSKSNSPSFNSSMFNHMNAFMWFLTPLSTQGSLKLPMSICLKSMKSLDQGWIEMTTAQGIFTLTSTSSSKLQTVQFPMIAIHLSLIITFIIFSTL
uniref:NADH-ubiquinone oxidoreductase chain 5 n=1 Tax=Glycera cf. tridactyla FS20 TaxID=1763830 RepID=A0A0S3CR13_9ANNE|nr:NADH dehydrogenase subunit 5 [Glycera cf. tridactyla FS20]